MSENSYKSYWRDDIDDNYFRKQIKFALLPIQAALKNRVEPQQTKGYWIYFIDIYITLNTNILLCTYIFIYKYTYVVIINL